MLRLSLLCFATAALASAAAAQSPSSNRPSRDDVVRGVVPYMEIQVDPQTGKTNLDPVEPQSSPVYRPTSPYQTPQPAPQNLPPEEAAKAIHQPNPDGTVNNPLAKPVKRY